jgi:hypothetical protein
MTLLNAVFVLMAIPVLSSFGNNDMVIAANFSDFALTSCFVMQVVLLTLFIGGNRRGDYLSEAANEQREGGRHE